MANSCSQVFFITIDAEEWESPSNMHPMISYIKGQKELCRETGYVYWKIICYFQRSQTIDHVKLFLNCPSAQITTSSYECADSYMWNDEIAVEGSKFEHGSKSPKRDSKRNWDAILTLAKENKISDCPAYVQIKYGKELHRIAEMNMKPVRRSGLNVFFIFGETGSDKTHFCLEKWPEAYWKHNANIWWDGYIDEKVVIIDDFEGEISPKNMRRYMDECPCLLEIKGSLIYAHYTTLVITSRHQIKDWWRKKYKDIDLGAIQTRITRSINIKNKLDLISLRYIILALLVLKKFVINIC
ncbi:Replication-associated protein [Thelohanellus kitauei]|uniref:Replication-associated protein n=1 Tax=Thelohanellus kitauei TaxID=669202 RepID=A0A0C2IZY7_THEKT|nr:Replication-associated protein [Thelohanellus kitauei]